VFVLLPCWLAQPAVAGPAQADIEKWKIDADTELLNMKIPIVSSLLACLAVPGISRVVAAEDTAWPQFRGPNAAGGGGF